MQFLRKINALLARIGQCMLNSYREVKFKIIKCVYFNTVIPINAWIFFHDSSIAIFKIFIFVGKIAHAVIDAGPAIVLPGRVSVDYLVLGHASLP